MAHDQTVPYVVYDDTGSIIETGITKRSKIRLKEVNGLHAAETTVSARQHQRVKRKNLATGKAELEMKP